MVYPIGEPFMEPYSRHVLVCTGGFCSPDRRGRALYSLLASLLQREGLLFGPQRVKRGETPCLGVCAGGPIVVVYPEGVWYAGVTPELLERIVVEHLKEGRIIDEAVFHRLDEGGTSSAGMANGEFFQELVMSRKRELIEPNEGDKRFVRRDEQGQFSESDDVSRSLSRDQKRDAETEVQSGEGDRGDRKST